MPQNADEFMALVAKKKPGDTIDLKITRRGEKEMEFKITLGERFRHQGDGGSRAASSRTRMGSKLSDRRA